MGVIVATRFFNLHFFNCLLLLLAARSVATLGSV
jgi:hypothetical protein